MKKNIVILSLSNNYSRDIGKRLADFFDMFYIDLNDILEYNLVDENMLKTAGREYFETERTKIIKGLSHYENSLIVGNLELFFEQNNIVYLKNNYIIIYLHSAKNKVEEYEKQFEFQRNLIAFEEEDKICKLFKDIQIEANVDVESDLQNIKKELQKYAENYV